MSSAKSTFAPAKKYATTPKAKAPKACCERGKAARGATVLGALFEIILAGVFVLITDSGTGGALLANSPPRIPNCVAKNAIHVKDSILWDGGFPSVAYHAFMA
uniref:Uncharacterized protein n=1 Tax=Cannabis sativa TaxID=3483 RepID=A0A803NGL7_CANSA